MKRLIKPKSSFVDKPINDRSSIPDLDRDYLVQIVLFVQCRMCRNATKVEENEVSVKETFFHLSVEKRQLFNVPPEIFGLQKITQ